MQYFVFLGAGVALVFIIPYILETLKGQVKPNRVTWLLWTLAPLIGFFASLSSHGFQFSDIPVFMAGFTPLLVLIASFISKSASWQLSRFDLICGAVSLLTLVLWLLTKNAVLALALSILSDFLAAIPTAKKAWTVPKTEHPAPFIGGIFSSTTGLLALERLDFVSFAFPAYLLLMNISLVFLISLRRRYA